MITFSKFEDILAKLRRGQDLGTHWVVSPNLHKITWSVDGKPYLLVWSQKKMTSTYEFAIAGLITNPNAFAK